MQTSYEVSLRGARFHARVGILPHERELPQPVEFDVIAWPRGPRLSPEEGVLLDYRIMYEIVAKVVNQGPADYLEGMVAAIAERVMAAGRVQRVRVVARKPHVALPGPVSCAEVAIELALDE